MSKQRVGFLGLWTLMALIVVALLPGSGGITPIAVEQADEGWFVAAKQSILHAEYGVRSVAQSPTAVYQAPNRANEMRVLFSPDRVELTPRTETAVPWTVAWTLTQVGDETGMIAAEAAHLVSDGNRLAYERGVITEWYINDARGLQQGFTLDAPPNHPQPAVVYLELALDGTLTAHEVGDGEQILFTMGDTPVLSYSNLYAFDATAKALPSRMKLVRNEDGRSLIQLEVDTALAEFPIVVDPVASTADWIAGIAQDGQFGFDVSTAGDVNNDGFDDVIVGANTYDGGSGNEGAAFIFLGSDQGLKINPSWQVIGNAPGGEFGFAVSEAGDVNGDGFDDVIVGSPGNSRATVFFGKANMPNQTPDWSKNQQAGSQFGFDVSSAGDVNNDGRDDILIGAPEFRDGSDYIVGRAFVYHGSDAGPANTANWVAQGSIENGRFGFSVSDAGDVNGDTISDIVIGDPVYPADGNMSLVVVYLGVDGSGLKNGPLSADPPQDADWSTTSPYGNDTDFGFSVSKAGDVDGDGIDDIIVGAPLSGDPQGSGTGGAAHVFFGPIDGDSIPTRIDLFGSEDGEEFGFAVSTAGDINQDGVDDLIIGAPSYVQVSAGIRSANGTQPTNEGAAYLFSGDRAREFLSLLSIINGGILNGSVGFAVDTAGDTNRDGYSDVIIGAPSYSSGLFAAGRAFSFNGTGEITEVIALNNGPNRAGKPTTLWAMLDVPDSGLNEFSWDFGDGNFGTGQVTTHTYTAAGTYTATVTVVNPFSSPVTDTTIVEVTLDTLVTPSNGGQIQSPTDENGRSTKVQIPAGTVNTPTTFSFVPLKSITEPTPSFALGYYFDLSASTPKDLIFLPLMSRNYTSAFGGQTAVSTPPVVANPAGQPGCPTGHTCFEQPITLTFSYDESKLDGKPESDLTLVFWDTVGLTWIDAANTCEPASTYSRDLANNTVSIDVCHFTRFGVVGAN